MASLLPNGKQQFVDINGKPLVGGFVYFYVPSTTTPKSTWQNPTSTILNTNPVELDSRGQAVIYGDGQYRQIVTDSLGNLIWDQLTGQVSESVYFGVATGTANNIVLTPSPAISAYTDGLLFTFKTIATTTSATVTFNINGLGQITMKMPDSSAPAIGTLVANGIYEISYNLLTNTMMLLSANNNVTGASVVGTRMLFVQAAAPTGWTLDASLNDRMLRINSASGGTSGGSWTISGCSVDAHTLSTAEMPSHSHVVGPFATGAPGAGGLGDTALAMETATGTSTLTGGGTGHVHPFTSDASWRPLYVNAIICTKA